MEGSHLSLGGWREGSVKVSNQGFQSSGSSREQQVASQAASTGVRDRQRTRATLLKAATLGLGSCMVFVNR